MSFIRDEEDLLRAIQVYVKANLNTKIAAINTEKADFLIDTIPADDDHYVFAGELLDLPNHTFVNFAIAGDIDVNTNHGDKISTPSFYVEVAFDNPEKPNTYFKALRYMRALYETILGFESSAIEADDLLITKAIPMIVTAQHRKLVVSGVNFSVAIS
jgi:hypothetical protein